MGDFEIDTRVARLSPSDEGSVLFRAALSRDWEIWGPNGGYVAAIALRAAGQVAKIPRPASFSCHYLSVGKFEEVELEVTPLRLGRRAESLRVSMTQGGKLVLEGMLRTASEGPGLVHDVAAMPDLPRPAQLRDYVPTEEEKAQRHAFWSNFDVRPPDPSRFEGERKARPPEFQEWYRFSPRACFEDVWVDAARSMLLIDTITWPAAVGPYVNSGYVAPSLDLAVWFHRARPASEWLLADMQAPIAEGGAVGANGRVFSESGELLASGGAQLLCAPLPS